jgi:hypothetical protein
VPVLVPVPAGFVFITAPAATSSKPTPPPAAATGTRRDSGRGLAPNSGHKHFRNSAENAIYAAIVQDLEATKFSKALEELESWAQREHGSDYADERQYFYMLAYNGLTQPAKVLDAAAPLFAKRLELDDPMQALSAAYVTVASARLVKPLSAVQAATARRAADELLALLPQCLAPERKPAKVSTADWTKGRADLEAMARQVLGRR